MLQRIKRIKSFIKNYIYYSKEVGLTNAIKLLIICGKKQGSIYIKLKDFVAPIELRANTSDIATFEQIFIRKDYGFKIDFDPKLIVDGGAYVGYSTVYFHNRFPRAKIIALEPAQSNYELLLRNISECNNVSSYNVGLWSKQANLTVKDEGYGEWGFLVEEAEIENENIVEGITIQEVLDSSGFDFIDILKLDIEGSEIEIFSKNYESWLDRVKVLIIELHDRIRPGCSDVFFKATRKYNFSYYESGENLVLVNNDFLD